MDQDRVEGILVLIGFALGFFFGTIFGKVLERQPINDTDNVVIVDKCK